MTTPINLLHIALAHAEGRMLTSPDGKRVEIDLEAIRRVIDGETMAAMLRPAPAPDRELVEAGRALLDAICTPCGDGDEWEGVVLAAVPAFRAALPPARPVGEGT